MKKILLYSNQGLSVAHLAMELEVMEQLRAQGTRIQIVKCDNKLSTCYFNPCHNVLGCGVCESRSDVFYDKIGIPPWHIHRLRNYPAIATIKFPFFATLDDLFKYEYEGVNLGLGVASSIISIQREYNVSSHTFGPLIEEHLRMAILVLLNFKAYIQELEPDEIYVFNGRFAEVHPVLELAKQLKIPFRTLEKGATLHTYDVYDDCLPHNIATREKNMDYYWEQADAATKVATVEQWFKDKSKGTHKDNINYLTRMTPDKLPDGFDETKVNVVIYNSSEDEFKAIPEWQNTLFYHQNDAIAQIVAHFQADERFHFYLRVHPNLGKVDNTQTQGIEQMNFPNLTVIPAYSAVDSYSLLSVADKVITFGSSIGVEASWWGKASILYGKSFYMNQDCVYVPKSFPELVDLLQQKDLPAKPRANAYKYAYFLGSRGQVYENFEWNGKFDSRYRGELMKRIYPWAFAQKLVRYLSRIPLWLRMTKLVKGRPLRWGDVSKLKEENVLK